MSDWTTLGLRDMPSMSGHSRASVPPMFAGRIDADRSAADLPLFGITTDGRIRTDLFRIESSGVPTSAVARAAQALLARLDTRQCAQVMFPLDAIERRTWFNIHPNIFRHGLPLEEIDAAGRTAALAVVAATLSTRGYRQARDVMRLNGLLAEITKDADAFGEWPYWLSLFGEPSADAPWAWQIDGHHLNLNCLVLGDQLVFTPSFMGSEPCRVEQGRLAGTEVFVLEERAGLALVRSLDERQLGTAVLRPSIAPSDLPDELNDPIDGRMQAGAFKDNTIIATVGAAGSEMNEAQRERLRDLIGAFVGWANDGHADVKMREVDAHLDETYFCWMGNQADDGPFYYRVQSPVVLIEFDHHPGVVFDNRMPSRHHVHAILRTPNGGDYGADLLRQHYERFDHRDGQHHA